MGTKLFQSKTWQHANLYFRILLIICTLLFLVYSVVLMLTPGDTVAQDGKVILTSDLFKPGDLISLDGEWEFYWDRLLSSEDFLLVNKPVPDTLMKVPGTWDRNPAYPGQGVSTYRLTVSLPRELKDPALSVQMVATAYRLYANGQLLADVGTLSKDRKEFREGGKHLVVELPKDASEIELIFQVGNLNFASGGLRQSLILGSLQELKPRAVVFLATQLLFIGSVFIFGIHYLLLFAFQRSNKTALIFSVLCFITALRASIWDQQPILVFLPDTPFNAFGYINYITGYNQIAAILIFVVSIYPLDYGKRMLRLVLFPTLCFDVMLFLFSPSFLSRFTNYVYLMILMQLVYIIAVMIKAVLKKRDHSIFMFIAICFFALAINQDILHYKAWGGIDLSYAFLYGNVVLIMAMSFVQARQQHIVHQKLIRFNENLAESDRLKDKIMSTEMSFLQAQIKPHFLYNALNAIANVCEKDGKKASKLIIDLAIYLRRSFEFNYLDKTMTIEKELEFVDTYFHIEQARFGEKIQLLKEIEGSLEFKIPIFVLQPLVENAVRHGISKKKGGGTIWVRVAQSAKETNIEIEDDGVGIEENKLESILTDERVDQGVGLLNIHHRLLRLYGRGLEITSEAGIGTHVKLIIPR